MTGSDQVAKTWISMDARWPDQCGMEERGSLGIREQHWDRPIEAAVAAGDDEAVVDRTGVGSIAAAAAVAAALSH